MKQYKQIKIIVNVFNETDIIRTSYTDNTLPWVDVTPTSVEGFNN